MHSDEQKTLITGEKQSGVLRRVIAVLGAIFLTVSAITPASSMFIIMPGAINQAGTGIIYSLIISAVIGCTMGFVYGELASALPSAGGEYVVAANVLGPWISYVTILLNASVMMLIATVLAMGAGDYFASIMPDIPPWVTAILIILLSTVFGLLNIRLNAWITGAFLLLELLCIGYFCWTAISNISQPASILLIPKSPMPGGGLTATAVSSILLSISTVVFAFNGYEQAVYLGEEIKNVRRAIPKVIIWSLAFGLILEIIPVALLLLASKSLSAVLASNSPFSDLVLMLSGEKAKKVMSLGISVAVLNACIVNIIMASRFLYATGRDGYWGKTIGFRLSKVDPDQGMPWVATLIVGAVGVLACLIDFHFLLVMTGTGLIFIYAILCLSLIVGRENNTTSKAKFRAPFYPVLPIFGIVSFIGIAIANWFDLAVGRPSLIVAGAEILIASAAFWVLRLANKVPPIPNAIEEKE